MMLFTPVNEVKKYVNFKCTTALDQAKNTYPCYNCVIYH